MALFGTDAAPETDVAEQARAVAPVVWLLGKVQSGKSSIVRALTGATRAEVGDGFRPCTRSADIYELPPEAPVLRFLDTRGLGEAAYDPTDDIAFARGASHCTIAVMRAMDPQQDLIFGALREIRRQDPAWPIVVAQTHLHEGYDPGMGHPPAYAFASDGAPRPEMVNAVPEQLVRALKYQRGLIDDLPGNGPIAVVAIDFTKPEDGLAPHDYGLAALHEALAKVGPSALVSAIDDVDTPGEPARRHRLILGHAAAASVADLIPVAAVAAVPAVQARLLHR